METPKEIWSFRKQDEGRLPICFFRYDDRDDLVIRGKIVATIPVSLYHDGGKQQYKRAFREAWRVALKQYQ